MKAGWDARPLGEVAQVVNGGTPESKVKEYWGGDVQWLTPKDMGQMNGREIGETPRTISEEGLNGSSARIVPERSVILSTRAPIGHLAVNTVPMAFNQGCRGIVPGDQLDHVYLYYFLAANKELLNNLGTGTTFKELSATNLKGVTVPLPPLEEQQRIVEVLDEALEGLARARAHAEANLKNALELFESFKHHRFVSQLENHPRQSLGEVCTFRNGKAHEKAIDPNGSFVVINSKFISSEGEVRKKTGKVIAPLAVGETVMVMSDVPKGKTLGKCFLIDKDNEYTLNQRICAISSDAFDSEFLFHQLNRHSHFLSYDNGENQTNLRKSEVLSCPLFIPPRDKQREMVDELNRFEGYSRLVVSSSEKRRIDLEELQLSLLQRAFSGELT